MSLFPKWSYAIFPNRFQLRRFFKNFRHSFMPHIILGDHLKITGEVIIRNGDMVQVARNRIVSRGLREILEIYGCTSITNHATASSAFNTAVTPSRCRLGTDTTTVTTEGMTALIAEIATDRNAASVTISKITTGQYRVSWTSTWNAGTVSGTVGEMGLFHGMQTDPTDAGLPITNPSSGSVQTLQLFSRLSAASGDFTAFAINTSAPLVIEWRLNVNF